jgi:hypothetical protein
MEPGLLSANVDFKIPLATAQEASDFVPEAHKPVPLGIINYWLVTNQLRAIPSNVFELNGRNRDAERARDANSSDTAQDKVDEDLMDDAAAEFHIGEWTDYFPKPEEKPMKLGDRIEFRDKNGQVAAVLVRDGSGIRLRCPTVYLCHKNGFIISRDQGWRPIRDEFKFDPEFDEVVGEAFIAKPGARGHVLSRSYMVLSSQPDGDGYLRVWLYSNLCNNTNKAFFVHHLVLITFKGRRPEGHVGHHIDGSV